MSLKQKSIAWTVLLVLVVLSGTLAFVVGRARRVVETGKNKTTIEPQSVGKYPEQVHKLNTEVELITVRSKGFDPVEIKRPQGPFLLAVDNHSESDELSIQFRSENGAAMKDVRFSKRQSKQRTGFDLPPGRYVLTEDRHPDWICRIIITAR